MSEGCGSLLWPASTAFYVCQPWAYEMRAYLSCEATGTHSSQCLDGGA